MSHALIYLVGVRPEALGHYYGFLKDAGRNLDRNTRNLIPTVTKVLARTTQSSDPNHKLRGPEGKGELLGATGPDSVATPTAATQDTP